MMEVRLLGTGDAFGCGGRLQTCALVESGGSRLLVDCGASALSALRRHGIDPNTIDAVLLTHLHGDHFGGVPFLLMDAHYATARRTPLLVVGPPGVETRVHDLHEALFPGTSRLPVRFALRFVELEARSPLPLRDWTIEAVPVVHSSQMPCFGLRLETAGAAVAFSGDTAWTDTLVELAREVDLFVCECYGFDAAPPGHLDYATLMRHRASLSCRRLLLTHMGEEMLDRAAALGLDTAADGLALSLPG